MTIHIGLIGGGNITETHARAARAIPGVEISAIHGTNPEKIARLCREHGGTPYQDLDAFLNHRPMDLVIIGNPSGLHAAQGIAAMASTSSRKSPLKSVPRAPTRSSKPQDNPKSSSASFFKTA